MKPNYHDINMTHNRSDVIEANRKVMSLITNIEPYAKTALEISAGNKLEKEEIDYLYKHLAYAISAFWSDISIHEKEQLRAQDLSSKVVQDFDLITSRVYITKDEALKLIPVLDNYPPA